MVVTSTIQPMAVLPSSGMKTETAVIVMIAAVGMPLLLRCAILAGRTESLASA